MDIKLMIVDDEALIAEDIADLCTDIGFPPVCVAYRAGTAIDYLKNNQVDLVLLDINLEDQIDGVEIAEFINEHCDSEFIFLTSYSDQKTLQRVTKTNPAGFIVKPFNKEQLLSTIILAVSNQRNKYAQLTLDQLNAHVPHKISEREFQIIELICKGKSNAEIADDCFLSINTVKYHIKQIFQRLDLKSRMELLNFVNKLREEL